MQHVWPYLSIWNTLHQTCYGNMGNVVPRTDHQIYAQRKQLMSIQVLKRDARHAVRESTLKVCSLQPCAVGKGNSVINQRAHREPSRPTGELTSPHLHSHMHSLSPAMTQPLESERERETGSHFIHLKSHLQSHCLPTSSVITSQTE